MFHSPMSAGKWYSWDNEPPIAPLSPIIDRKYLKETYRQIEKQIDRQINIRREREREREREGKEGDKDRYIDREKERKKEICVYIVKVGANLPWLLF